MDPIRVQEVRLFPDGGLVWIFAEPVSDLSKGGAYAEIRPSRDRWTAQHRRRHGNREEEPARSCLECYGITLRGTNQHNYREWCVASIRRWTYAFVD